MTRALADLATHRTVRILLRQALLVIAAAVAAVGSGRGSPAGIALGAALLAGSFVLQSWAASAALGPRRRPALALALFTLKLGLLLVLVFFGFRSGLVAPLSFAVGATTLLLAIVVETCYPKTPMRRTGA